MVSFIAAASTCYPAFSTSRPLPFLLESPIFLLNSKLLRPLKVYGFHRLQYKPGRRRKPFRERPSLWSSIRSRSLPTKLDGDLVDNEIAIDVEDLCLEIFTERGEIPILKSCSMKIPKGEFWMLLGPNGCGKSTILKALAGILRSSHGNVLVQGPRSFVFQNPDHQVVMPTAEADVAFGLGCLNLPEDEVKERVFKSLEVVGMSAYAQRPIQTLSGGQKQRIAIAGALAEASQVLLLDELTTFLDEYDQKSVLEAVQRAVHGSNSVTALWVTHRLEELEYADGAVYMEDGKIILSGNVGKVSRYIERQKRKAKAR